MDTAAFFAALKDRALRDTSVMSHLRRSLAEEPGSYAAVYPWIEPWTAALNERRRRMAYLAAGLWALAERRAQGPVMPLVEGVRQMAHARESASIESRFTALLDADDDELAWRLRHVVQLLATDGTAIDWPALLDELFAWNQTGKRVQQQWARRFWSSSSSAAENASDEAANH